MLVKGVLYFTNAVLTPQVAKGSTVAKYSVVMMFPPTDPQVALIQAQFNAAAAIGYPQGIPVGTDVCWKSYDERYKGKDYYDPRFSGFMVLSGNSPETKPFIVVDSTPALNPITMINGGAAKVFGGCVANLDIGIVYYDKGRGGVGGFPNGLQILDDVPPYGRFDGAPTKEQMFGGAAPAPAPAAAPQPPTPPVAGPQMTAKAAGATYDSFISAGWTDETLIQNGYMVAPGGVPLSFA